MSLNPWIDYLQLPELDRFLQKEGYDPEERITPRAICNHPSYTRMGFIITQSGELLWHPQNLAAELSLVLEYWRTHGSEKVKKELTDWNLQLHGRTAEFAGKEIVHLYTASGNQGLITSTIQLLLNKHRIHSQAIILDEYGKVLGIAGSFI